EGGLGAVGTAHAGDLVEHAGRRVVLLPRLQVSQRERGRERADREGAAGPEGGGDAAEHGGLVAPAEQPETALAQTDGGVELPGPVQVAHVELLERHWQ